VLANTKNMMRLDSLATQPRNVAVYWNTHDLGELTELFGDTSANSNNLSFV